MNLKERETQLSLIMIGFILYLLLPLFYWLWLDNQLESGASLAAFVLFWFFGLVTIPIGVIWTVLARRILKRIKKGNLP